MKTNRGFPRFSVLALALLVLSMLPGTAVGAVLEPAAAGVRTASSTQAATVTNPGDDKVDAFKARLEADGFTVQEGKLLLAPMPYECCKVSPPPNLKCTFFNQASPYQAAYLPYSPNRPEGTPEVDYLKFPEYPNLTAVWRLQPDEAIVLVGLTPPPVRYFGFQSYLFLTVNEQGQVWRRWNNFGDQENQLTIHTAGTPNGTPGNPFNSLTVRITTADQGIDARVRAAAQRAGYPPAIMNTEPMPQSLLRMGVDAGSDMFSYLLRAAMPLGGDKGKQDLENYKTNAPVRIFRVTPNTPPPADPFPIPQFRIHGTGQTEFSLLPTVRELRTQILQTYGSDDLDVEEFQSFQGWFYGLHHMDLNDDGLAPSTDSLYLKTGNLGTLGEDDFMIIYGANHYKTGKASYMNATIYGLTKEIAADDIDDAQLQGSADAWLPGNPDADKLYVYKIARHCDPGDNYCFAVPEGCCGDVDPGWDTWRQPGLGGIKLDEETFIVWRNYLDPTAKTGADPNEVILDKVIKFSPK